MNVVKTGSSLTLAAAAAAMFALAPVSTSMSTSMAEEAVKCMGGNTCKGPQRLQDRNQRVQGPERLQGTGVRHAHRSRVHGGRRHG